MVFYWSLSDSRVSSSLQDSSQPSSIMLSFRWSTTSKSSRPFNNPLVTVPEAPITIGTIVTFMFHSFFNSLARSRYLSFFSHSFSFILWSAGTAKSTILQTFFFFFFFLVIIRSGLLAEIRWSVCMSKSHYYLCEFFTPVLAGSLSLEFHKVFRTHLSILADLNNVVVWMISIPPPISNHSNLLFKLWVPVV